MSETKGKTPAKVAEDSRLWYGLSLEDLGFKAYDGTLNMSRTFEGCQVILKEKQSLGFYVYWSRPIHVTNLVS